MATALVATFAVSCGQEPAPQPKPAPPPQEAPAWPPGVGLAVGEVPITTAEVDRLADWIKLFNPGKTAPAYRRLALTSTLLQRAAVADHFATERAAARAAAEASLVELEQSQEAAPIADGGWAQLGLVIWGETRELPLNAWAGPVEDIGRFLLLRPIEAYPGELPGADEFRVEVKEFPYVPDDFTPEALQAVVEDSHLQLVDPELGELVPTMWRYWMHATR